MNHLRESGSYYLQQHADNPVDWFPWSEDAWRKAAAEDKMVIVSIGYSACHWCHVMEHEVFSDTECADYMNSHFVSIKVDREEFPHIDQLYMDAVQLMGQRGGWPLNVFCTPERIPIYGGTYFPKQTWLDVLQELNRSWKNDKERIDSFAMRMKDAFAQVYHEKQSTASVRDFKWDELVSSWKKSWDWQYGGFGSAPKFVMPPCWMFLLEWCRSKDDQQSLQFLHFSLHKILSGGIYDHVQGGICRYSVDQEWHIPHFEKMLYDNAQILQLLAYASDQTQSPLYHHAIEGIVSWLEDKMVNSACTYAAAMDADSEGEEGKYYSWSHSELEMLDAASFQLLRKCYDFGAYTSWENGQHVLRLSENTQRFLNADELKQVNEKLLHLREKRSAPATDTKVICSWNCMLIIAFCDLAILRLDETYVNHALRAAEQLFGSTHQLYRIVYNSGHTVPALHEDYAMAVAACIKLHQAVGDLKWLNRAVELTRIQEELFKAPDGLFYMSVESSELFQRKKETQDGVIPSSNSTQAHNYFSLGLMTGDTSWTQKAEMMLSAVLNQQTTVYGSANWLRLLLKMEQPRITVVMASNYLTHDILKMQSGFSCIQSISRSTRDSSFPAHEGRKESNGAIYVCTNSTCEKPVFTIEEAQQQLMQWQKRQSSDAH